MPTTVSDSNVSPEAPEQPSPETAHPEVVVRDIRPVIGNQNRAVSTRSEENLHARDVDD
jgi:hypothetical protein